METAPRAPRRSWALMDGRTATVAWTDRRHGDLDVDGNTEVLAGRRASVVDLPWTWLRQVHGATVVIVDEPGARAGARADGSVTTSGGAALAAHTADCVPIGLVATGDPGAVGVVHAGWRGLAAGVVTDAVQTLAGIGAGPVEAVLGPCIHSECYAFGPTDLVDVAEQLGPEVATTTPDGDAALDLPTGAALELERAGVDTVWPVVVCTACDPNHFSHRARRESGRTALVAWIDP